MAVQLLFHGTLLQRFVLVAFSCNSYLAISPYVSPVSFWYIQIVELTQVLLGRNYFDLSDRLDSHMINNLSIAVHAF